MEDEAEESEEEEGRRKKRKRKRRKRKRRERKRKTSNRRPANHRYHQGRRRTRRAAFLGVRSSRKRLYSTPKSEPGPGAPGPVRRRESASRRSLRCPGLPAPAQIDSPRSGGYNAVAIMGTRRENAVWDQRG